MFSDGFAGWLALLGFLLALAAIWLISHPAGNGGAQRLRPGDLLIPLAAGISFGIYFILMHRGSQQGVILPMTASRSGGVLTMVIFMLVTRRSFLPNRRAWLPVCLNGILDVSGNALYILAGQHGRV